MAVVVPLTWVVGILWSDARDIAGVTTLILPALILSQELTVLVIKGRISRTHAALVRLTVIGVAVLVPYLIGSAIAGACL